METYYATLDAGLLSHLPREEGKVFPRGRVLIRQGDPAPAFYIVLTGQVQLLQTRLEDTAVRRTVLATLGPGGVFGELAAFTGEPSPVTAIAAEDCTVLALDPETAAALFRTAPQLAVALIRTLCQRLRALSERRPESPSVPAPVASRPPAAPAAPAAGERPQPAASPSYRTDLFWPKSLHCPLCQTAFTMLLPRPNAVRVERRESDFHEVTRGVNPLYYQIAVCPQCLYAAYLDDFATLAREEADALRRSEPQRRALAGRLPFTGERDVVQATRSFELAIQCYQQRQTRPPRLGGLYHRLAWLAREQGDVVAERTWPAQALAHYQQVYLTERLDDETTELTLQYLIGELHLRLGQVAEARRWFSDLLRHPALAKKPYLATMVRDRWEGLRAGEIPAASRSEA